MLPSLLPTRDIAPMLEFARAGSVAALFFFDHTILQDRQQFVLDFEKGNDATAKHDPLHPRQSNSKTQQEQQQPPSFPASPQQQQQKKQHKATAVLWAPHKPSEVKLDTAEEELLNNVADCVSLSKHLQKSRTKSITALVEKHRSSNMYSEQYYAANRVGGEDGMRLLLSTIAPKNRHRFGAFGSVIESNAMLTRFSGGASTMAGAAAATLLKQQQLRQRIANQRSYPKSCPSAMESSSSPSSLQQQPAAAAAAAGGGGGAPEPFFSLGAYMEELRENSVEAFGSACFVRQVAAILQRVSDLVASCPTAQKGVDSVFHSSLSYSHQGSGNVNLERAVFNVSPAERFKAFSIFFEAGLTYLFLGSSRLAVCHLVRAGAVVSVMLRGADAPPLLARLRALLCLAFCKFFCGMALQRCNLGVEAAQELRRARYLFFDADAMCRAMMRSSASVAAGATTSASPTKTGSNSRSANFAEDNDEDAQAEEHQKRYRNKSGGVNAHANSDACSRITGLNSNNQSNTNNTTQQQQQQQQQSQASRPTVKANASRFVNLSNPESTSGAVPLSIDDIGGTVEGFAALSQVRQVTRSFVRHCMLHEGLAISSTVVSPLLFHVSATTANNSAVVSVPSHNMPESLNDAASEGNVFGETHHDHGVGGGGAQQQEQHQKRQRQQAVKDAIESSRVQLEASLRALRVVDEVADATHDVVGATAGSSSSNLAVSPTVVTPSPPVSSAAARQPQKKSESESSNNSSTTQSKQQDMSTAPVQDVFLLAETCLSLLLSVCFSPDIGAAAAVASSSSSSSSSSNSNENNDAHVIKNSKPQHASASAVTARNYLSRGVQVATQLIHSCQAIMARLYPMSLRNDLDIDSEWLLQRPMLRPGVVIGCMLRHAYLIRAIFHSLRLLWPDASADLSILVNQIEVAEEPVPRHVYSTLRLVNTALMQQRDSVHLVRTTKDVLPPVLPVSDSRLSSEHDVLLKLLPVIEVLRQTLLDGSAARATVEVNYFSNGVIAERVSWKTYLEEQAGLIVSDGFRLEDYATSQSIRTQHILETVTVQHVIEARKQSRIEVTRATADHKFLLPPFPFSATLRCDVTGEIIPLQLDSDDTSVVLFSQCRACGLRISPGALPSFSMDQKRVCIAKLTANALAHVGCSTRHCVSVGTASDTRLTVADLGEVKSAVDAEKLSKESHRKKHQSFVQRSLAAVARRPGDPRQKWEEEWKVGRMTVWDPVSFTNLDCSGLRDEVMSAALAQTYRLTSNNPYETLLWNPVVGPFPEGEPVVWVMPLNSSVNNQQRAQQKGNSSSVGVNNNPNAMVDLDLVLQQHIDRNEADVVTANCLEVIRDKIEDASSDHIHRMVRGRTTRKQASDALKNSCCILCNKSLLHSAGGGAFSKMSTTSGSDGTMQHEDDEVKGEGDAGHQQRRLGSGAEQKHISTALRDELSESAVFGAAPPPLVRRDTTIMSPSSSSLRKSSLSSAGVGESNNKKRLSFDFGFEQNAKLDGDNNGTPEKANKKSTSTTTAALTLLSDSNDNNNESPADGVVLLSKAAYLAGSIASQNRAIFFFRCVVCGAVVHKQCGTQHADCGADGLSPSPTSPQQQLEKNSRRTSHDDDNNNGNDDHATSDSSSHKHQRQQKQEQHQPQNTDVMVKHPMRIVHEHFDIDSLHSLKAEYDRMETAEVAAQRSGETLRKWVENDRSGGDGGGGGDDGGGGGGVSTRRKASLFASSMSHAKYFESIIDLEGSMEDSASGILPRFGASGSNNDSFLRQVSTSVFTSNSNNNNLNSPLGGSLHNSPPSLRSPLSSPGVDGSSFSLRSPLGTGSRRVGISDRHVRNQLREMQARQQASQKKWRSAAIHYQTEYQQQQRLKQQQQQPRSPSPTHSGLHSPEACRSPRRQSELSSNLAETRKNSIECGSAVSESGDERMVRHQQQQRQAPSSPPATPPPPPPTPPHPTTSSPTASSIIGGEVLSGRASNDGDSNNDNSRAEQQHLDTCTVETELVRADKPLDELTLRILFREHSDPQSGRLPLAALDGICGHVGLTGGQLAEMLARKYGFIEASKRTAEQQQRGVPDYVLSATASREGSGSGGSLRETSGLSDALSQGGVLSYQDQLQGFTEVTGSLSYPEFCLVMSLVAQ